MFILSKFMPSKVKGPRVFLVSPDVPKFWGGYYAIYNEGPGTQKFWVKRWHQTNKGKLIKKAFATIKVESAHKINWMKYMGNPYRF